MNRGVYCHTSGSTASIFTMTMALRVMQAGHGGTHLYSQHSEADTGGSRVRASLHSETLSQK
jgi:hypothetical protein